MEENLVKTLIGTQVEACWRRGKDLIWPDAGISSLDLFIVNFEPFCGDIKPVEHPESRVERLPRRGAILLRAMRLQRDKEVAGKGWRVNGQS